MLGAEWRCPLSARRVEQIFSDPESERSITSPLSCLDLGLAIGFVALLKSIFPSACSAFQSVSVEQLDTGKAHFPLYRKGNDAEQEAIAGSSNEYAVALCLGKPIDQHWMVLEGLVLRRRPATGV